jgi:hypothetical protein
VEVGGGDVAKPPAYDGFMRTTLMIAMAVAGCTEHGSTGHGAHDLLPCSGQGPVDPGLSGECEAACNSKVVFDGNSCGAAVVAIDGSTMDIECGATFTFERVRGCCFAFQNGMPDVSVHFAECQ